MATNPINVNVTLVTVNLGDIVLFRFDLGSGPVDLAAIVTKVENAKTGAVTLNAFAPDGSQITNRATAHNATPQLGTWRHRSLV